VGRAARAGLKRAERVVRRRVSTAAVLLLTLLSGAAAPAGGLLDLTPEQLAGDLHAQRQLFQAAQGCRERQQRLGRRILEQCGGGGEVRSLLKRPSAAALAAAIHEKCARNHYLHVGQMDDIVRGRFDLIDADGVERVVVALQLQRQFPVKEAVGPRRPQPGGGYGYPRWHIVVRDPETGLSHEWQVGTRAVTEVYEREGITLPAGLLLGSGMRPNLHDLEYEVFFAIRLRFRAVYDEQGLPAFHERVDQLAAEAGLSGAATPDLEGRIATLHEAASGHLRRLTQRFGADWVERFYR